MKSVGLGAIIVIGAESDSNGFCSSALRGVGMLASEPLACTDILGRSMVERSIERLAKADAEAITILVASDNRLFAVPVVRGFDHVQVTILQVDDVFAGIAQTLKVYADRGVDHCFVSSANLYAETDLLDLFYFHREARQPVTRCLDSEGPLDLWVVHCDKASKEDLQHSLTSPESSRASYFTRDYVNRLQQAGDLRRLVSDTLSGHCAMRPTGREMRPGVWVEERAEIDRGARIVAPAFIGRGAKVRQDALITRCSNIEKDCCIDCGTVVEDSSILSNTNVGIWLDLCHAVVSGNKLLSLGHDVVVEIADPSVLRSTAEVKEGWRAKLSFPEHKVAGFQRKHSPAPEWQLGVNLIQG